MDAKVRRKTKDHGRQTADRRPRTTDRRPRTTGCGPHHGTGNPFPSDARIKRQRHCLWEKFFPLEKDCSSEMEAWVNKMKWRKDEKPFPWRDVM